MIFGSAIPRIYVASIYHSCRKPCSGLLTSECAHYTTTTRTWRQPIALGPTKKIRLSRSHQAILSSKKDLDLVHFLFKDLDVMLMTNYLVTWWGWEPGLKMYIVKVIFVQWHYTLLPTDFHSRSGRVMHLFFFVSLVPTLPNKSVTNYVNSSPSFLFVTLLTSAKLPATINRGSSNNWLRQFRVINTRS